MFCRSPIKQGVQQMVCCPFLSRMQFVRGMLFRSSSFRPSSVNWRIGLSTLMATNFRGFRFGGIQGRNTFVSSVTNIWATSEIIYIYTTCYRLKRINATCYDLRSFESESYWASMSGKLGATCRPRVASYTSGICRYRISAIEHR